MSECGNECTATGQKYNLNMQLQLQATWIVGEGCPMSKGKEPKTDLISPEKFFSKKIQFNQKKIANCVNYVQN